MTTYIALHVATFDERGTFFQTKSGQQISVDWNSIDTIYKGIEVYFFASVRLHVDLRVPKSLIITAYEIGVAAGFIKP